MTNGTETIACARSVPLRLVLLDNAPTVLLHLLGAVILLQAGLLPGLSFILYSAASFVWFWGRICTHCRHFDTAACPCGYGFISARLFKRKTGGDFRKIFRRNILFLFPLWFAPPGAGLGLLAAAFSAALLIELIAFCLIGFALIPLVSRLAGCKFCESSKDCPWMNRA